MSSLITKAAGAPVRIEPVRIEVDASTFTLLDRAVALPLRRRIAVVVPCFNRPGDLALLLGDLGLVAGACPDADLRIVVVDNASEPPLDSIEPPPGLDVLFLRLRSNTGGSGGFNAGMAHALSELEIAKGDPWAPEFLWLVDSDARVTPDTLIALLRPVEADSSLVAAGSAIAFPFPDGRVFEVGGRVDRRTGKFGPAARGVAGLPGPIACDYVAACSALVRADAVRRAGLMPDVFLNGDDVEWFIRLAQRTGGRIAGVPDSVVFHPTFDRFPTLPRYYIARNGFGPIDALGLGRLPRFLRAMREVARALGQTMLGRDDLARLHMLGLSAAARRQTLGPAPVGSLAFEAFRPFSQLGVALTPDATGTRPRPASVHIYPNVGLSVEQTADVERQLIAAGIPDTSIRRLASVGLGALLRRALRPDADIAIVPGRGRPKTWFAGRTMVLTTPGGFVLRRPRRIRTIARAGWVASRGLALASRIAARGPRTTPMGAAPVPRAPRSSPNAPSLGTTLGVVILSHNRWPALRETVDHLIERCGLSAESLLVVDNASSDGTPARLAEWYPEVGLLRLDTNIGVDAFNTGVRSLGDDVVLILDDDARPDPRSLHMAMALLADRPDLGAVTLHPRHPASGVSEWPFADAAGSAGDPNWPVMGCCNLVRRSDWERAGGYESRYFLYRNDTDLALKLLALGRGVYFNPDWTVWHDSPAARRKSPRWHRLATRNWMWTARRHGRGMSGLVGTLLGWGWAHRLAGLSPSRHWATLRGVVDGIRQAAPAFEGRRAASRSFCRLLRLHLRAKPVVRVLQLLLGKEDRVR